MKPQRSSASSNEETDQVAFLGMSHEQERFKYVQRKM